MLRRMNEEQSSNQDLRHARKELCHPPGVLVFRFVLLCVHMVLSMQKKWIAISGITKTERKRLPRTGDELYYTISSFQTSGPVKETGSGPLG